MVGHGDVVAELARRQPVADIHGRLVAGDVDLLRLAARDFHAVLVELLVQGRVKSVRQCLQPVAEVGLTQAVHHALSVVVRRWRRQDFGCWRVELVADMPRVDCPKCGVVVAMVSWAEPSSRFTRDFESECAWPVSVANQKTVGGFPHIVWRTAGDIARRVAERLGTAMPSLFDGLAAIGVATMC